MAMQTYQPRPVRSTGYFPRSIERFMDEFSHGWPMMWQRTPEEGMGWAPNIEVYDKGDKLVVRAEVPGIKKDDLDISVSGDMLMVSGERKTQSEVKEEDYFRSELSYGKFARSIELPATVDPDRIEATYDNGILEITMNKTEEAKPRKIEIKARK